MTSLKVIVLFIFYMPVLTSVSACDPREESIISSQTNINTNIVNSDSDDEKLIQPGGPFMETFVSRAAPPLIVTNTKLPPPSGREFHITIDAHKELKKISKMMYGNNAAVWLGEEFLFNPLFSKRLATSGLGLLRWPGGSTSDHYHWTGEVPRYGEAKNWPDIHDDDWAPNTGEFVTFAQKIGTEPVIVVNHGYTSYGLSPTTGSLKKAVQMAADWVEYCNAENDGSNPGGGTDWAAVRAADGYPDPLNVKYWEVGNEVFGEWEIGHVNGARYAVNFTAFAKAMKQIDPSIYVGANVVVNFDTPGMTLWMKQFLSNAEAVNIMDFVDLHDYFKYVHNIEHLPSDRQIREYFHQIEDDKVELDRLFKKYAKVNAVPYFFGEYHLTHPQNPLNVTLASGLVIACALGEFIKQGFAAAAMWDVANEWKNSGDLGFVSRNHPTVPDFSPYPVYYPYYMFSRNFGDTLIASYNDDWKIKVYAGKFSDGVISLIIINPYSDDRYATVDLGDSVIDGYINGWVLEGPEFMGTNFYFNSITTTHRIAGTAIKESDAYFSDVGRVSSLQVPVPPNSVTSVIIY